MNTIADSQTPIADFSGGGGGVKCLVKISKADRALRVHRNRGGKPLCGGGRGGKSVLAWQEDLGPANCGRCEAIAEKSKPKTNHEHTNHTSH